jgi:hypothetical protein
VSKSLWERTVDLTILVGERILAPVERFIGKRSLVGDATFFPLERFPWVERAQLVIRCRSHKRGSSRLAIRAWATGIPFRG